jgi:hypothetical protein
MARAAFIFEEANTHSMFEITLEPPIFGTVNLRLHHA